MAGKQGQGRVYRHMDESPGARACVALTGEGGVVGCGVTGGVTQVAVRGVRASQERGGVSAHCLHSSYNRRGMSSRMHLPASD